MFRTNRHQPDFDALDGMVLLSTDVAAPDVWMRGETAIALKIELNGTLHGNKTVLILDAGVSVPADGQIVTGKTSYFDTSGRLSTLGKVSGSFGPDNATNARLGQLPDLSNLTLNLSNHAGSVRLTMARSTTNHYEFKITGGTGSYALAYGSGSLTITYHPDANEYLLRLQSVKS